MVTFHALEKAGAFVFPFPPVRLMLLKSVMKLGMIVGVIAYALVPPFAQSAHAPADGE